MEAATRVPQRVLIVGGSSEIGSALARAWVDRGTRNLVLTQRGPGRIDGLVEEPAEGAASVRVAHLDAMDPESIAPAIAEAWSEGDVDVAVVAIGLLEPQESLESDPSRAREVLTVNTTATIEIALEIANRLEKQMHGTLVLLSSVAGQRGRRDNYVYGASKAAVDTFAEGLQQRLSDSGARVLVVRPGYVYSRMSSGIDPAPFAVTVDESRTQILRAVERGQETVWVPSILGWLFFVLRLLPRKAWNAIVRRMR